MSDPMPDLHATIEDGLVCPKCLNTNVPGAKPYIKMTEIVLVCDICAHSGELDEFLPKGTS